jgi:hypothetical protein
VHWVDTPKIHTKLNCINLLCNKPCETFSLIVYLFGVIHICWYCFI